MPFGSRLHGYVSFFRSRFSGTVNFIGRSQRYPLWTQEREFPAVAKARIVLVHVDRLEAAPDLGVVTGVLEREHTMVAV